MITLRLNSVGPMVELLQRILKQLGFYNGDIDGFFGYQTFSAVRQFQESNGLVADGIVGPNTWAELMPYINGYTTYTIQSGDTFYSIARRFSTTVNALIYANVGVDYEKLQVGETITVPFGSVVPTDISYSSNIMNLNITALRKIYPFLSVTSIGTSVLGKSIPVIRFGTGQKEVFYNASFHANEWITTPLLMKFLETLCKSYVNNVDVFGINPRELFTSVALYIVPMVNPDGVDLVTRQIQPGSAAYTRAKIISSGFPDIDFPNGWKANIEGVDLNLQFPAGWEEAREIKYAQGYNRPAPRDFVGFGPLTAPESLAVYNFTLRHNFNLVLAYHTQGRVIFYEYQDYTPEESRAIADKFAKVSGYAVTEVPYASSFAGYKDWFIYYYRKPGFTIEAGIGTNPLPISQFDSIYSENLGILVLGMLQ